MKRHKMARLAGLQNGDHARLRRIVVISDHIAAGFVAFVAIGLMVLL